MTLPASAEMKLMSLKTYIAKYIYNRLYRGKYRETLPKYAYLTQIVFVKRKKKDLSKLLIFFQKHTGILKFKKYICKNNDNTLTW